MRIFFAGGCIHRAKYTSFLFLRLFMQDCSTGVWKPKNGSEMGPLRNETGTERGRQGKSNKANESTKAQQLQQHRAEWPAMLQATPCTVFTLSRESKLKPATVNFLPAQVQIKGRQTACGLRNKRLNTVFVLSSCGVIL